MLVVIGSTGMQQGLAFYQLRKLLRVLKVFNGSEVLELLVLYAPHIHIQAHNRIIQKHSPNSTDRTKHRHRVVLLVETITWTRRTLKTELK
jgi:hypothetical protein